MNSSRSPDMNYNSSGYLDLTARDAIANVDRERLKLRRKRVIEQMYKIAADEGFKIGSYIKLIEIEEDGNSV